jgi:4-hydroxymandelate oxidase
VLGLFTRVAGLGGAALLLLYYAAHPPFGPGAAVYGGPGSYLIVDRNLVEMVGLLALAVLPAGALWGIDRVRKRAQAADGPDRVSLDRRDVFANLAGVPVLGALAAAVAGVHSATQEQGRGRDVIAAATPRYGGGIPVRPGNIASIRDYERLAPSKMSVASYEFVASGAGDDQSVAWNEAAYQRILLHQKALIDVTKISTSIQIFGRILPHPIFLSPVSSHGLVYPEGERATARGAGAAKANMIVSTFATEKVEDIAKAATGPLWHATYMFKDKAKSKDFIQRAEACGYEAIVVPSDTPVVGARDREHRTYRFSSKPLSFQKYPVNYYRYPTTWADIEWYRAQTKLPLLLKGILDPDDAERAIKLGANGIIVSNHGGRNLDTLPATIDILPSIVERVAGRVPVLVDGGIRRGTDVLKALALGATAVAIGRPYIYGLAVKGAEGVTGVVNILRNELEMAMACTGRPTIASIDRSVIAGRQEYPKLFS